MESKAAVKNAMQADERAIREMVDTWLEASKRGDTATLLNLLADDVLFITPGRDPFGRAGFAGANQEQMSDMKMDAAIDIKEIEVAGDWAWMRSFLRITFTRSEGDPSRLSGHILTILQRNADGKWVIKRDANFVAPEPDAPR